MIAVKRRLVHEHLIYIALWAILFIAPLVSIYVRSTHDAKYVFLWDDVFMVWHIYLVYLVVFLIHNFALAPMLVNKHRKLSYFVGVACLLPVFVCYQCQSRPAGGGPRPGMEMMGGDPGRMGHRPPRMPGDSIHRPHEFNPEHRGEMERHGEGRMMDRHHDHRPPIGIGLSHLFQLVVMILMLGMNLGVKLYFKNLEDQKEMRELESRSLSQQLAYLKYQINPHFYMNTLNNIHALVDIDPERAKETILILSRIMRYVLYEADKHLVPVGREVEFLMNYIHLMKLRYTDKVSITTDIPAEMPDAEIPPLVFITFVENAFKHGVSYKQQSFVDIHLQFSDGRLRFNCRNSKPVILEERGKRKEESGERKEEREKKNGGVGLANVKQRLDIIYDNDYTLDIQDNADTYEVLLLLPINRDV